MNSGQKAGSAECCGGGVRACVVPVVFLALGGLLASNRWQPSDPVAPAVAVAGWATDPATIRHPTLRPEVQIGAFVYRCNDCHSLFPSGSGDADRMLNQHREIELKHGINANCFNCHHREDRDAYVDNEGNAIPADKPQLLCAKCHGLVWRDWTHGVHGRTSGYWDASLGPLRRAKCIECHDPHVPPFPPMRPAPGPNTLRMGEPGEAEEHPEVQRNPLLIFEQAVEDAGTDLAPAAAAAKESER